jgi:hypothetical protein
VSREVTAAAVCVLALGAGGAAFATERDVEEAPRASVRVLAGERPGLFAGGLTAPGRATRIAGRTARSARAHAARGRGAGASDPGVVAIRRGRTVSLHRRPGAPALAVIGDRTRFGSPVVLAVVRRKPGWLGVLAGMLGNGKVGWIRDDGSALSHSRNPLRIEVDRSEQRLDLLRGSRRVLSAAVGVGRPGSETPTGRFAVTDKLSGARYTRSYGCCVLALTGSQPRLPAGWRGGNRLAIHGTDGRSARSVGSAGCVTADREPLERLMRWVPLGTVVTIRP